MINMSIMEWVIFCNYTYDIQPVFVWNGLLMLCYFAVLFRCPVKKKKRWKSRLVLLALILAARSTGLDTSMKIVLAFLAFVAIAGNWLRWYRSR